MHIMEKHYSIVRRFFWGVMAVMCVLFSSASKRLIQLKLAPYLTVNEVQGKKLKDGCRDRKEKIKLVVKTPQQHPGKFVPDFFCAFYGQAWRVTQRADMVYAGYAASAQVPDFAGGLPLYIRQRRLLL